MSKKRANSARPETAPSAAPNGTARHKSDMPSRVRVIARLGVIARLVPRG